MKKDDRFYWDMQRYIAVTTIGPSTLRNQGASGVIKAAQKYLAVVDLAEFNAEKEEEFLSALDVQTDRLRAALPSGAQHWGAARKALNVFLRDVCYNRFLCEKHGLASLEDWMEIPLDGLVAQALKRKAGRGRLPRWPGISELTPDVSGPFQAFARRIAASMGISRMRLWVEEREGNSASGGRANEVGTSARFEL